jgi:hypothetical protein
MDLDSNIYYPKDGEQLGQYQPHLEYLNDKGEWVESGVITATHRENSKLKYRVNWDKRYDK